MQSWLVTAVAMLMVLWPSISISQPTEIRIGFLSLANDPRYDQSIAYARVAVRPGGDALEGAQLAVADMKIVTDARKLTVLLDSADGDGFDELATEARRMIAAGARYILVDLDGDTVDQLSKSLLDAPVTLLNTTAPEDWLRSRCYANLLHTAASDRMISDALIQHLMRRQWTNVLILKGKTSRDDARAASFTDAARRFRLRVVDSRVFDLSTNPAMREQNNIALLTAGTRDYDIVYIADEVGEFSRYVPYQTTLARPVIGSTGLVALEWHWSLERYGAPQVNLRFERQSTGARRMGWQDWSAWIAMRAVLTAHAKARELTPEAIDALLRSVKLRLDGSKGVPLSFRPWSGQLRTPILLATQNAIIDIAPLEGFTHRTNTLDSLGVDESEFTCD